MKQVNNFFARHCPMLEMESPVSGFSACLIIINREGLLHSLVLVLKTRLITAGIPINNPKRKIGRQGKFHDSKSASLDWESLQKLKTSSLLQIFRDCELVLSSSSYTLSNGVFEMRSSSLRYWLMELEL